MSEVVDKGEHGARASVRGTGTIFCWLNPPTPGPKPMREVGGGHVREEGTAAS